MSDIEMDQQALSERDRLQQLLCAHVLGECDAEERAEIEQALAKDEGLRAERERLRATVGLVKNTLGKGETLSWKATSEVTRAAAQLHAGPPPQIAWYRRSSFRAAASFAVLVGGAFLGWRAFVVSGPMETGRMAPSDRHRETTTALAPASEETPKVQDALTALGYGAPVSGSPVVDSRRAGHHFKDEAGARAALSEPQAGGAVDQRNLNRDKSVEQVLAVREVPALQKRGSELKQLPDATAPAAKAGEGDVGLLAKNLLAPGDPFDAKLSAPGNAPAELGALVLTIEPTGQPSAVPPAAPVGGLAAGSDEYYLGRPAATAAVGAAGAPSTPGASGPGSPGPGGIWSPGLGQAPTVGLPLTATGGGGGGDTRSKLGRQGEAKSKAPGEKGEEAKRDLGLSFGETLDLAEEDASSIAGFVDVAVLEEAELDLQDHARADSPERLTDFEQLDRFAGGGGARDDDEGRKQRRVWTPEERRLRAEHIVASCKRLPDERPRDMFFRFWGDNPFEWTANDRQSTFAMDVDTASYTLARKYLVENHLPEKAQVRTEEFVNYFKPDVAPPSKGGGTFAIATELAPSRFSDPRDNKWMLRVAVRGMEVARNERAPLALTLVVDVSGSMKEQQRLELVKHALRMLVSQLDPRDMISIVTFSADSRLILPMTSAGQRGLIESAIDPLQPDGGTNTEAGLRMGYEQALAVQAKHTINRVVLLTDGVANIGITDPNVLVSTVERQRKAGIYLNTIGVGMNNHNDHLLEQLADKGDGLCNYVDDAAEVKKVLVDDLLKTLVPIARDAKVQVEFDPAQVESYRLLGYENRAIADQDFRNDKVDAGEINSGHQITALYEIVRTASASDAPLAKVQVRFKPPHKDGIAGAASEEASEISSPVFARNGTARFEQASYGYRRAVLSAQFAEFLRRSVHARGDSLDQLIADVQKLTGERNDAETAELADMVVKSRALLDAEFARRGRIERAVFDLRHSCFEQARLEARRLESDRVQLAALEREIAERELNLRKLLDPPQVR